jgi:outer membrane protein assembly factor BamB
MNKKIVSGIILSFLVLSTLTAVSGVNQTKANVFSSKETAQTATVDWPMFRYDLWHSGGSSSTGPSTNSTSWNYKTNGWVTSSPAVADGKVYIGSHDGYVYCFNATTGAFIWKNATGTILYSSPAVVDGRVYVGSCDKRVYCLNASTGAKVWPSPSNRTAGDFVESSPAVADGKVYIGSNDHYVYCLDALTGKFIWNYSTGGIVFSSPAVVRGILSRVFVGSYDGYVYCLDANGAFVWRNSTGASVESSPAVADGRVYVGSNDGYVYCLDANRNGTLVWRYKTGGPVKSSPAVVGGRVYVGSNDHYVYCLDVNGTYIWRYLTGGILQYSSPAVNDNYVYVGSNDGYVYCLDANGAFVWRYKTSGPVESSPAVADGRVYVGSYDCKVYAFGLDVSIKAYCTTENADVAVSIWMDGQDTGFKTPHTFTSLTEPHNFSVSNNDPKGHPFREWSTGQTTNNIKISSSGEYTAFYSIDYILKVTTAGNGTTNATGTSSKPDGTVVNVTATPGSGHVLNYSRLDGKNIGTINPIPILMNKSHNLLVVFSYDVTIEAWCPRGDVSVNITIDYKPTGFTTPHTFTNLTGIRLFGVDGVDSHGHPFKHWESGETNNSISISALTPNRICTAIYLANWTLTITTTPGGTTYPDPGTYTDSDIAYEKNKNVTASPESGYGFDYWVLDGNKTKTISLLITIRMNRSHNLLAVFTLAYFVTIKAHCIIEGVDRIVEFSMDNSSTVYRTPRTFLLVGTHNFNISENDTSDHQFKRWNTGQISRTIIVNSSGTYVAYYGIEPVHDIAVTDVIPCEITPYCQGVVIPRKTIIGDGFNLTIYVALANPGDYPEDFNVSVYINTTLTEFTLIESRMIHLEAGESKRELFIWNTSGWSKHDYVIKVVADTVPDDDPYDNTFTDGTVRVTIPGDVYAGDFHVDIQDATKIGFYWLQPVPPADADFDIDGDGIINVSDATIVNWNWLKDP